MLIFLSFFSHFSKNLKKNKIFYKKHNFFSIISRRKVPKYVPNVKSICEKEGKKKRSMRNKNIFGMIFGINFVSNFKVDIYFVP